MHTPWQQKVFTKLVGLQYGIIYRLHQLECSAVSIAQPQWLLEVADSYASNDQAKELIAKLVVDPQVVPHFTYRDGLLRYKQRVWIGNNPQL